MRLIVRAKLEDDYTTRMKLWLFATASHMYDDFLEDAVITTIKQLRADLRGVRLENCEYGEESGLYLICAEWYDDNDGCGAPVCSSAFKCAEVHAGIVKALGQTLRRWKYVRSFGSHEGSWVLNDVALKVEPIPD